MQVDALRVIQSMLFDDYWCVANSVMSARKIESVGSFQHNVTVEARQTRLSLSPDSVVIHKNGIEFRSATPFPAVDRNDPHPAVAGRRRQGPLHRRRHLLHRQQARRLPRLDGLHRPVETGPGAPDRRWRIRRWAEAGSSQSSAVPGRIRTCFDCGFPGAPEVLGVACPGCR